MLTLGEKYTVFQANNALSEIFYDNLNQKIITISGEGVSEVRVYGLDNPDILFFRLRSRGKIRNIKFSSENRLLSVQFDECSVDFIDFSSITNALSASLFTQVTKNRSRILGLEWITVNQIVFVTNQGLELYQVNVDKKAAKLLKSLNVTLYWYIYHPQSQLLIASSGAFGALLNPFVVQNGSIHRLTKFEVDFGRSIAKSKLSECEVTVAYIYGTLYIILLRYCPKLVQKQEIVLYKVKSDEMEEPEIAHIFSLRMIGAFALHVFDNLVIVHHQSSCSSLIFDVGIADPEAEMPVTHEPLIKTEIAFSDRLKHSDRKMQVYNISWVTFQPNIVVDATVGILASVSLHLMLAEKFISSKYVFLRFLYNRNVEKSVFLEEFKKCLVSGSLTLKEVSTVFGWIAEEMARNSIPILKYTDAGAKYTLSGEPYSRMEITQQDIVGTFFLLPDDYSLHEKQRFLKYMLRFLLALQEKKLEVQPYFLNEVLVPAMVAVGQLEKLHQLLLFRVIPDAKQLAFQLLSHEAKYPPLVQLALDMLSRLGTATEEIAEVLIARGYIVEAIRFLENIQSSDKVNALKLLECAWKENRQIRHAVFTYFQEHGSKSRYGNVTNSEHFVEFEKKFKDLFSEDELEAAKEASFYATRSSMENGK